MRQRQGEQTASVGHDSFLDIVTNMVGILIVLVMVVGLRIRNAPLQTEPDAAMRTEAADLARTLATENSLRDELLKTQAETQRLKAEAALRDAQRLLAARLAAQLEERLAQARERLDAARREEFDLSQAMASAQETLEELRRRAAQASSAPQEPEVIESYPTALSRIVDGPEVHFQLRAGRIAWVPVESLLWKARDDMRRKLPDFARHADLSASANVVGPEGGFRFRYEVQRFEEVVRRPEGPARREGVRMVRWSVVPVSSDLGEPVDAALGEDSAFRRALAGHQPAHTTVTVWVYPDSFESFRAIRKELHRLGYACAARPLPEGVLISGSIEGTKSAAE